MRLFYIIVCFLFNIKYMGSHHFTSLALVEETNYTTVRNRFIGDIRCYGKYCYGLPVACFVGRMHDTANKERQYIQFYFIPAASITIPQSGENCPGVTPSNNNRQVSNLLCQTHIYITVNAYIHMWKQFSKGEQKAYIAENVMKVILLQF